MRKFLSALLTLIMVFSVGTAAFATTEDECISVPVTVVIEDGDEITTYEYELSDLIVSDMADSMSPDAAKYWYEGQQMEIPLTMMTESTLQVHVTTTERARYNYGMTVGIKSPSFSSSKYTWDKTVTNSTSSTWSATFDEKIKGAGWVWVTNPVGNGDLILTDIRIQIKL